MSDHVCSVAADTKLETPEGPLMTKTLANKPAPVLTKEEGRVRFRRLQEPQLLGEAQPVLRIALETGSSFRVGPEQVVFLADGSERRARELTAGDALLPAFTYPAGYEYHDDVAAAPATSAAAVRVTHVEPDGTADVYQFSVNVSGCFFVAAGVLCRAANA